MGADRVVLVAREGWVLKLLEDGLREASFVTASCHGSIAGLARIQAFEPDCIVVEAELDEHDGYWLTQEVRKAGGQTGLTPVAVLAPDEDHEARRRVFEVGADALLHYPFRLDEIVAQLRALVEFARRMRERRTSLIDSLRAGPSGPASSRDAASFRGELTQMPVSGLLTLLEHERKTGLVSVRSEGRRVTLDLAAGLIVAATIDGVDVGPLQALGMAIEWRTGTITFRAEVDEDAPPASRPIRALLGDLRAIVEGAPLSRAPVAAAIPMVDLAAAIVEEAPPGREPPQNDLFSFEDLFDPPRPSIPAIVPAPPVARPRPDPAPQATPAPKRRSPGLMPRPTGVPAKVPDPAPEPPPISVNDPTPSVAPSTQEVEVPHVVRSGSPKAEEEGEDGARSTLRP